MNAILLRGRPVGAFDGLLGRLAGLPDPSVLAQQAANAQAAIVNAPANAQAAWNQATSEGANGSRIVAGADAAGGLLQHGYNPDNPADNQALVAVIAAGVSLIPGVGPVLGGALELLDQVALGIADVLEAIGLIPKPGCHSTGTFTTTNVLAAYVAAGADMTPGSFGALAWPMLAYNASLYYNCTRGAYTNGTLLSGLVALWNAGAGGAAVPSYIPTPKDLGDAYPSVGHNPPVLATTASSSNTWPPLQPLFAPVAALWSPLPIDPGNIVTLNAGPFVPQAVGGAPSAPSSSGTTTAVVAAGGAAVVATGALYAYAASKGLTMAQALSRLFG